MNDNSITADAMTQAEKDAAELARVSGHRQELQRTFSPLSMIGFAFAILNSWTALSASLSIAVRPSMLRFCRYYMSINVAFIARSCYLPSGGPVAVIWGLVLAAICNFSLSASLAEICSVYPTSGGQYHWIACLSTKKYSRGLSYFVGWVNTAGWWALTATGGSLGANLVTGIIALVNTDYEVQRWHTFLIYLLYTLLAYAINIFGVKFLPLLNKVAFIWSLTGVCVISVTLLATASPNFQSGKFVFGTYINQVGWNNGIAWLLGLLQGSLGLTGYDAVAHMIEELPDPARTAPLVMVGAVAIGTVTGLVFLIILLFSLSDVDRVITSPAGALLEIFYQATGNKAGAIILDMFPVVCMLFATTSIMSASSRMTYAFARDNALPFSNLFKRVHPKLNVPVESVTLTTVLVILFGCIYLGSSAALNAILSASVVALGISYATPLVVLVIRGRHILPRGHFRMPDWLGLAANIVGILFVILTTVLFLFPPELPVTGTNMNYTVAAFALVVIVATIYWFTTARKGYKGPGDMNLGGVDVHMQGREGEVEMHGISPTGSGDSPGLVNEFNSSDKAKHSAKHEL